MSGPVFPGLLKRPLQAKGNQIRGIGMMRVGWVEKGGKVWSRRAIKCEDGSTSHRHDSATGGM